MIRTGLVECMGDDRPIQNFSQYITDIIVYEETGQYEAEQKTLNCFSIGFNTGRLRTQHCTLPTTLRRWQYVSERLKKTLLYGMTSQDNR
jgi:hypothetical protein